VDMDKCNKTFVGAEKVKKGEKGYYLEGSENFKPSAISPFFKKPRNLYNTGQAVCGAKGCTRACMVSLESRGVLKNKFEHPFRTKKLWSMDWSEEGIAADQPGAYKAPYEGLNSVNTNPAEKSDAD